MAHLQIWLYRKMQACKYIHTLQSVVHVNAACHSGKGAIWFIEEAHKVSQEACRLQLATKE
jgi:hypothetical protein